MGAFKTLRAHVQRVLRTQGAMTEGARQLEHLGWHHRAGSRPWVSVLTFALVGLARRTYSALSSRAFDAMGSCARRGSNAV
jgi:hypothetical protein